MVHVLAMDFEVVDRFGRAAGGDGGDAGDARQRGNTFAGGQLAGGDEGVAVGRVERVAGGDADRGGRIIEPHVQHFTGRVGEPTGHNRAGFGGDGRAGAYGQHFGVADGAEFGHVKVDRRADDGAGGFQPRLRAQQFGRQRGAVGLGQPEGNGAPRGWIDRSDGRAVGVGHLRIPAKDAIAQPDLLDSHRRRRRLSRPSGGGFTGRQRLGPRYHPPADQRPAGQ